MLREGSGLTRKAASGKGEAEWSSRVWHKQSRYPVRSTTTPRLCPNGRMLEGTGSRVPDQGISPAAVAVPQPAGTGLPGMTGGYDRRCWSRPITEAEASFRVRHKQRGLCCSPKPVGHRTPVDPPGGLSRERDRTDQQELVVDSRMRDSMPSRGWHKHSRRDPGGEASTRTELRWGHLEAFAGGKPLRRLRSPLLSVRFLGGQESGPAGGREGKVIEYR